MDKKSKPERRTNSRAKVRKVGRILVDGASKAYVCIILDVSDTGALLLVHDKVPDRFALYYAAQKTVRPVTVVRRQQDTLGVRFDGEATRLAPGDGRLTMINAA